MWKTMVREVGACDKAHRIAASFSELHAIDFGRASKSGRSFQRAYAGEEYVTCHSDGKRVKLFRRCD